MTFQGKNLSVFIFFGVLLGVVAVFASAVFAFEGSAGFKVGTEVGTGSLFTVDRQAVAVTTFSGSREFPDFPLLRDGFEGKDFDFLFAADKVSPGRLLGGLETALVVDLPVTAAYRGQVAGTSQIKIEGQFLAQFALGVLVLVGVIVFVFSKLSADIKARWRPKLPFIIGGLLIVAVMVGVWFNLRPGPVAQPPSQAEVFVAAASPTPPPEPETKWLTYTGETAGFTISFPEGWFVGNPQSGSTFTMIVDATESASVKVGVDMVSNPQLQNPQVQKESARIIYEEFQKDLAYQMEQFEERKIGGYTGAFMGGTRTDKDGVWQYEHKLIFIPDGRMYIVASNILEPKVEEFAQITAEIIQSFDILAEVAVDVRLGGTIEEFVYSDQCVVELASFENVPSETLTEGDQCGLTYALPEATDAVTVQDWYRKVGQSWTLVDNSIDRLEKAGQLLDSFSLVRCTSSGEVDQEALIVIKDGQVAIDLLGVPQKQSYCLVSNQLEHLSQVRQKLTSQFGYTLPVTFSQKLGHNNLVLNYPSNWQAETPKGSDLTDAGIVPWLKQMPSLISASPQDESQVSLLAGILDDQAAMNKISIGGIKQVLTQSDPEIEVLAVNPGQMVQRRGIVAVYQLGDKRYTAFFTVFRRQVVVFSVSAPYDQWIQFQPLLLEMARRIRFQ